MSTAATTQRGPAPAVDEPRPEPREHAHGQRPGEVAVAVRGHEVGDVAAVVPVAGADAALAEDEAGVRPEPGAGDGHDLTGRQTGCGLDRERRRRRERAVGREVERHRRGAAGIVVQEAPGADQRAGGRPAVEGRLTERPDDRDEVERRRDGPVRGDRCEDRRLLAVGLRRGRDAALLERDGGVGQEPLTGHLDPLAVDEIGRGRRGQRRRREQGPVRPERERHGQLRDGAVGAHRVEEQLASGRHPAVELLAAVDRADLEDRLHREVELLRAVRVGASGPCRRCRRSGSGPASRPSTGPRTSPRTAASR